MQDSNPRLKKVIDAIRAHQNRDLYIRYHSDGDIRAIIDDIIEIGVDLLNPVQPECMPVDDVDRVKDRRNAIKHKLSLRHNGALSGETAKEIT